MNEKFLMVAKKIGKGFVIFIGGTKKVLIFVFENIIKPILGLFFKIIEAMISLVVFLFKELFHIMIRM